ncbi:MAG: SOS response-associated peptidase family protein [Pseudomonadota bacterium]
MCNRYVSPDQAAIERHWHIGPHNQPRWADEIFPRAQGPFVRHAGDVAECQLVVGQWGLIPSFAETPKLTYSTNNARFEGISTKASYKQSWLQGKRCIIPAWSFDEPCWETGRNVWWRFRRADRAPWGLAGLWNDWTDKQTGEVIFSYTVLTINADHHPLMSRMHRPDPKLPPDQQDKRSVVAIELGDVDTWLKASIDEASELMRVPSVDVIEAAPKE